VGSDVTGGGEGAGEARAVIDVDALVADVRRRAAALRERGAYPADLLDAPFDLDGPDAGALPIASPITLRPDRGYSSKPVVGAPITAAKRVAEKLVHHVVQDGLDQAAIRIDQLSRSLEDAERHADERLDDLSRSVSVSERRVSEQIAETREEVAALRARVDELGEAIARIERRIAAVGEDRPSGG
jgi:hypothetical protein